jgi:hypothetical protein
LRWGLVPYWCRDATGGRKPINAKQRPCAASRHFGKASRPINVVGAVEIALVDLRTGNEFVDLNRVRALDRQSDRVRRPPQRCTILWRTRSPDLSTTSHVTSSTSFCRSRLPVFWLIWRNERRKRRGLGKPETFNFLGFTFICGTTRSGKFQLQRKTRRDRMRAKLKMIKAELWRRMHQPIPKQGQWLHYVVRGYFNYHAVPTNARALVVFRHHVTDLWRRTLRRRSQKDRMTWTRMTQLADAWLPKPIILHPWPSDRFAVTYPRWEPYAGKPHVRFCAGGAR